MLPPGTCAGSEPVSASGTGCPRIACPEGMEVYTSAPADPVNRVCCPNLACRPGAGARAQAADMSQLSDTNSVSATSAPSSSDNSQAIPGYVVALLVIGGLILLLLIAVAAVLIGMLKKN